MGSETDYVDGFEGWVALGCVAEDLRRLGEGGCGGKSQEEEGMEECSFHDGWGWSGLVVETEKMEYG